MSTIAIHAGPAPKLTPPLRGFARAASVVLMLFDAFVEAQHEAYKARQRYPFMDW